MSKFLTKYFFKNSHQKFEILKNLFSQWNLIIAFVCGFTLYHCSSNANQDYDQSVQDLSIKPPFLPSFKISESSEASHDRSTYKGLITFKVNKKESELDLGFLNSFDLNSCVFQRGHVMWLFFDKNTLLDFKETFQNYKEYILNWKIFKQNDGNIIKLHLAPFIKAEVVQKSPYWHLILRNEKLISKENLNLNLNLITSSENQREISFKIKSSEISKKNSIYMGKLIDFKDPDIGDYLTIIPLSSGRILKTRQYSCFKFLPTYQGIVISHHSDTLDISQNIDQKVFTVTALDTLNLSAADYHLNRIPYIPSSLFDFPFKDLDLAQFDQQKQILFDKLMTSLKNENLEIRLALIKFYLSYGRPQEALGEFKILYKDFSYTKELPEILALYGLTQGLCGHFAEALEIFDNLCFIDDPEITLWHQVFQINKKEQSLPIEVLNENLKFTSNYSNILKKYLYFSLLKLSLKSKNNYSEIYLKILTTLSLTAYESEKLNLYHAYFLKKIDQNEEAFKAFQKLIISPYPRIRIQALYEYSTFFSDSQADLLKIINLLEKHRFSWRGDYLEVKILTQLIKFYIQSHQIEKALILQRQIMTYYPLTPDAKISHEKAQEIVFNFMTENQSNTPFKCVTFYEKFKDLFPTDQRQNQIKLILIDKYLELNLMTEAKNLLNEVMKTLSGDLEPLGPLFIKYSLIQLEEENSLGALNTLKNIENLHLSNSKTLSDKKVLEAQILTKQKKYSQALDLLEHENSPIGLQQKIDIAFLAKDWKKAKQFLLMLITMKEENQELTPDIILNLAVACYHGHYLDELAKLKNRFKDFMSKSPLANDFLIITTPQNDEIPHKNLTPEILNDQLEKAKKFDQFLETYQKNLSKKF